MARRALASLPRPAAGSGKTVLVSVEAHRPFLVSAGLPADQAIFLPSTPPGQALSTEAGVAALPPGQDIVVSSCDHGIVLDPARWARFRQNPSCDAAIFTVRGFPGVIRRPQAFAYVVASGADSANEFPAVTAVSVKKPVSETPARDRLLVGTFWFRDARVLQKGIDLVKAGDARVNGELYLDSAFELLRTAGDTVRVIDLDGYVNWGDPDSLAEALYWQEVFLGHRLDRRLRYPGVRVAEGKNGR